MATSFCHHRSGLIAVGRDLLELSFLQHGRQVLRELKPGERQNHKGGGARRGGARRDVGP